MWTNVSLADRVNRPACKLATPRDFSFCCPSYIRNWKGRSVSLERTAVVWVSVEILTPRRRCVRVRTWESD
jgi:hypothetical protein